MFKIKTTIDHLYSLLLSQDNIKSITIEKGAVFIDEGGDVKVYEPSTNINPIEALYDNVSIDPNICIDCLTEDNMNHSAYFKHSLKSYIHFLMINYGPFVPISRQMAAYFISHDLIAGYKIVDRYAYRVDLKDIIEAEIEQQFMLCQED